MVLGGSTNGTSTFSRNAIVDDIDLVLLDPLPTFAQPSETLDATCSSDGVEAWLSGLSASPSISGGAPLIRFDGGGTDAVAYALRGTFVGNHTGTSPLIEVLDPPAGLSVQLIQNTFADNESASLLDVSQLLAGSEVVLARNVFVGGEVEKGLVQFPDALATLIDAGNYAPSEADWLDGSPVGAAVFDGPSGDSAAITWQDSSAVASLSACSQHLARCADATLSSCEQAAQRGPLHCAVDRATELVPATAPGEEPLVFPWETHLTGVPGATGWTCADTRPAADSLTTPVYGDGDGYPDVIDCDNDDPLTIPFVLTEVGEDPCGLVQQGDDDDDDGDDDDDDDDDGDEDSGGGAQGDGGLNDVPVGCTGRGCGVALPVPTAALLFGLGLTPLRRRRRLDRGH